MLPRMLACALLLIGAAAFTSPMARQTGQDADEPATEPKWEYKVVRLEPYRCSSEQGMSETLNLMGRKGWELMSYERLVPAFPKDAEGTLLIRPAATGPGKLNNPQTDDSFQGTMTMTMKMPPSQTSECRLVFKRIAAKP